MRRSELKRGGFKHGRSIRQPSLYSRTEETRERKSFKWVFPLLFCIFLSAAVYIIFFSPYFAVNKVSLSDTKYVSRDELNRVVVDSKGLLNNNIITFGFFNFESRLGKVTGVKKYKIIRQFPNHIYIEIEEKSPAFVWQILDHKYLIDESGYAWANYEDKYASLPVIVDTKNVPVQIDTKLLPASFVSFVRDLYDNFESVTGTKIAKAEVLDIVSDLKVTSSSGWYVYFDTSRTAQNELTSLVRTLEEVHNKKGSLEYVDLRIDNRIFYK
jgi:cell division septal protein FtsQ